MNPDNLTPEQIAAGSIEELRRGRLPLEAQWRIAEMRQRRDRGEPGSYTSALSTGEFAAIRSVGFAPVGQVMGSAVFNVAFTNTGCGYYGYGYGRGINTFNSGGFSGYGYSSAPVNDLPNVSHLLEQARHRAVERLRAECAGLGGHGVVGVRLTVAPFYGNGLEFVAIGTAVAAGGAETPKLKHPFTSDLSGQEFAKLLRAGWVPVDIVQGVGAVIRHDDWQQQAQQRSWYNQEMAGLTALVNAARHNGREALRKDAAKRGGQGVVLQKSEINMREWSCAYGGSEGRDHVCYAFMWGTAITRMTARNRTHESAAPIPMIRLDGKSTSARKEGRR